MNFGVPGFQPPVPVPPPGPAPPLPGPPPGPAPGPTRRIRHRGTQTQYFDISNQDPPTDTEMGPGGHPLPAGMSGMLQQVRQQAAASSAAAADRANEQVGNVARQAVQQGQGIEKVAAQVHSMGKPPDAGTIRVLADALERESQARAQLAWQVQGLNAALEDLRDLHQAGPPHGTHGLSPEDAGGSWMR